MTLIPEPRHLVVRAQGESSPLRTTEDQGDGDPAEFTHALALDDPALALPDRLAEQLASWSQAFPPSGFASRPALRKYTKRGVELAQSLASHLGPVWVVRYWDASHDTAKFVCWGCARLHWTLDSHGNPPHPLHITVQGEYKWYPLRADGFGDFAPDDPAAALGLSGELVDDLYEWAHDVDSAMNLWLEDRDDDRDDARRQELDLRGRELVERLSHEIGPARTVAYGGV
ncbi:hypothetical protein ACT1U9_30740 [Streptomyces sp. BR1]|uniref:hypothetical protein n=1 Tax=Streptomyces sp. BR1 TaxID=1592323 RepID=UPI00402BB8A6